MKETIWAALVDAGYDLFRAGELADDVLACARHGTPKITVQTPTGPLTFGFAPKR
jgi:hypothetical protein